MSMQEMTAEQIQVYFKLVQRVCKPGAIWCNENRVEKVPDLAKPPVRAMFFPYDSNNEVLIDEVSRFGRLIILDDVVTRVERIRK